MRIPVKRERIFRLLFTQNDLTVSKISRHTRLPMSYVSKVLGELKKDRLVWGTEKLYVEPKELMRKWADLKRTIFQRIQPLMVDILILERIRNVVENYAISGPFAEMLVQGESSGRPLIVYLTEKEMDEKKSKIIKLGNTGRGQVWVYTYDEDILSSRWEIKGWKTVAIPQLCADVMALGTYADLGMKLFQRWLSAGERI